MAIDSPVFDNTKVTVIFVLGGPGAGMDELLLLLLFPHSTQARARNVDDWLKISTFVISLVSRD